MEGALNEKFKDVGLPQSPPQQAQSGAAVVIPAGHGEATATVRLDDGGVETYFRSIFHNINYERNPPTTLKIQE